MGAGAFALAPQELKTSSPRYRRVSELGRRYWKCRTKLEDDIFFLEVTMFNVLEIIDKSPGNIIVY